MKDLMVVALATLVGCVGGDDPKDSGAEGEGEGEDLGFDLMYTDCGPDDGAVPVLEIGLLGEDCDASPPADAPWVRVMISGMGSGVSAGSTYEVGSVDLSAWVYPTGGVEDYAFPSSGHLTLTTYTSRTEASGTFSFTLPDGEALSGSFDAGYCDREYGPCG